MGVDVDGALKAGFSLEEIKSFSKELGASLNLPDPPDTTDNEVGEEKDNEVVEGEGAAPLPKTPLQPVAQDTQLPVENVAPPKSKWHIDLDPQTIEESSKDLSSLVQGIYEDRKSLTGVIGGFLGINPMEKPERTKREKLIELNSKIVSNLKEHGFDTILDPDSHEPLVKDENGTYIPITGSLVNDMFNSKSELAGGVIGSIAGGMVAGAMAEPIPNPILKAGGAALGGLIGGATGASLGRARDMAVSAIRIRDDIEADVYRKQVADAGLNDVIDTITGGVAIAGAHKALMVVYNTWFGGNPVGAMKALNHDFNLTKEQEADVEKGLRKATEGESVTTHKRSLNPKEEKIAAVLYSNINQKRSQEVLAAAAQSDPRVATIIDINTDTRSAALNKVINKVDYKNISSDIRKSINSYEADVGNFYSAVKKSGADIVDSTDFTFSPTDLGLPDILNKFKKEGMSGSDRLGSFAKHLIKIEDSLETPNFSNLIDLRQTINEFAFEKKLSFAEKKTMLEIRSNVDNAIDSAANKYMANGKEWVADFKNAKTEYRDMKRVQENYMYKGIMSEAKTGEDIGAVLNKWSTSDAVNIPVFNQVLDRLPPAVRAKAEASAISNLTNKFSIGKDKGAQAINFPALSDAIKQLNINTGEGKYISQVVEEMAKLGDDTMRYNIRGGGLVEGTGVPISQSLPDKVQASFINMVFGVLRTAFPIGRKSQALALVKQTKRIFQEPFNFKTGETFIKSFPPESQGTAKSLLNEYRMKLSENPVKVNPNVKQLYTSGKESSGALGTGEYLTPRNVKGQFTKPVDMSKVATLTDASRELGRVITEKDIRLSPSIGNKLSRLGYEGITVNGKVKMFGKQEKTFQIIEGEKGEVLGTVTTNKSTKATPEGSKQKTEQVFKEGRSDKVIKRVKTDKETKQ